MTVLTVGATLPPLFVLSVTRGVLLAITGAAFFLVSTAGVRRYERVPTPNGARAFFGGQLALAATAIVLSEGNAALLVFGTLSQAVFFLGLAMATIVCSACLGLMALASWLAAGDVAFIDRYLPSYAAPFLFVVAFSWAIRRQREMQAEQARLARQLLDVNEQLRAHASEAGALAAERERVRIARDIHDSVGHCLTNTHIQLELAATLLDSNTERVRAAISAAGSSTREALGEVRRSVAALRDGAPVPLAHGIAALIEHVRATGVAAELTVRGPPKKLGPAVEVALFRVAQEAITNAQRHARGTRVDVTLTFHATTVALDVRDDGVGHDGADASGFGLRTMQERMSEVAGSLRATRPAGGGFLVSAEVPL